MTSKTDSGVGDDVLVGLDVDVGSGLRGLVGDEVDSGGVVGGGVRLASREGGGVRDAVDSVGDGVADADLVAPAVVGVGVIVDVVLVGPDRDGSGEPVPVCERVSGHFGDAKDASGPWSSD